MFVDSHCHLDRLDLTPYQGHLSGAIKAAQERGVDRMLCVGIDMANAERVVEIAESHDSVYASVGIHPMDVERQLVNWDVLERLTEMDKVIAIGETGLDYFYSRDSAVLQQESFRLHLELSSKVGKPTIVHTRDAREDTINIIREFGATDVGGVLHCFTEDWPMAKQAIDLNYYISFSGIVTFKNAEDLRFVAKQVPLDRLLIETDSPYLTPVPHRKKKNEPQYVVEVAHCLAGLHNISVERLAEITSENFDKLFF
ncbi:MAG: TatD DNase family protein [Gammaproteobacteria bacterium]|jgi:TatD DNase family protein